MVKLQGIKINENLKVGTFYIHKFESSLTLCLCIGENHYLTGYEFLFLDICALLSDKIMTNLILDAQCWDLQMLVDYAFTNSIDMNALFTVEVNSGIVAKNNTLFYSPYQYQIPDLNVWYTKQKMVNNNLPKINVCTDTIQTVEANRILPGKIYGHITCNGKLSLYVLAKVSPSRYEFCSCSITYDYSTFIWGTHYYKSRNDVPALVELENLLHAGFIGDRLYRKVVEQEKVRAYL